MIPVAYIEHQLPGRVRLRVPSRRGEVPFFEKVVRELSKHPAIRELSATAAHGKHNVALFRAVAADCSRGPRIKGCSRPADWNRKAM